MNYILTGRFGSQDFSTGDLDGKIESTASSAGEYSCLSTGSGRHELQHWQFG